MRHSKVLPSPLTTTDSTPFDMAFEAFKAARIRKTQAKLQGQIQAQQPRQARHRHMPTKTQAVMKHRAQPT